MTLARRRFLTIAAGSAAALALAGPASARDDLYRWRGTALGAEAEMLLPGRDAGPAIDAALSEIDRLEGILSLYRPDSALARLNRTGVLEAPPPELVAVLSHAAAVSALSGGVFDVTVQPLWEAQAAGTSLAAARALVDWRQVEVSPQRIAFARPGMKVTLNGIAQGYVSDRVAVLLRDRGFENVLVNLGESRALGPHPDGRPWRVAPAAEAAPLDLSDGALATSAPGTATPHLFDPATGRPGAAWRRVTVQARSAMQADALSTALALLPEEPARRAFAAAGANRAWLTGNGLSEDLYL